ncbi:unnamed protein product [Macrosiphum euphorbiae]|uniref:Transmembrane protein n=1 Tax=Macrosiphum euphorbiae TaxID=13131 RepID=A0AAV0XB26_9HEMI|nr:unnamed protein product [Macrosiphum euphorbiae]
MVTGEGTWTKGPFVKKTFLSFVLRTAAAATVVAVAFMACCIQTTKTSAKRCAGPPPNVLRDFSNKALFLQQSHSCTRQLNW